MNWTIRLYLCVFLLKMKTVHVSLLLVIEGMTKLGKGSVQSYGLVCFGIYFLEQLIFFIGLLETMHNILVCKVI